MTVHESRIAYRGIISTLRDILLELINFSNTLLIEQRSWSVVGGLRLEAFLWDRLNSADILSQRDALFVFSD